MEESEQELGDATTAKTIAKRRKKLRPRKRDINEEQFARGEVVRWTFSTHRDKKGNERKEVVKKENRRLREEGRHRSETLVKSRYMQWKKSVDVISEHHQASKFKSTGVCIGSKQRLPKTKKVESGSQEVTESDNENSESDQSDPTATRLRDKVRTKSRKNTKENYKASRHIPQRKSRKKRATATGDWSIIRIKERESQSFVEEFDMNPMTPLPDSDSPQVFINHGQVTCHSPWPQVQQH